MEREQDGFYLFRVDMDPNLSECIGYGLAGFLGLLHYQFGLDAGGVYTYVIGVCCDLNSWEFHAHNMRRVQDEQNESQHRTLGYTTGGVSP